jgi:hypothetical protein
MDDHVHDVLADAVVEPGLEELLRQGRFPVLDGQVGLDPGYQLLDEEGLGDIILRPVGESSG